LPKPRYIRQPGVETILVSQLPISMSLEGYRPIRIVDTDKKLSKEEFEDEFRWYLARYPRFVVKEYQYKDKEGKTKFVYTVFSKLPEKR